MFPWDKTLQEASVNRKHIILTANNRLEKFLYDYYLTNSNLNGAVTLPFISSFHAWVNELATQLAFLGITPLYPMTQIQQQWLWQQAVKQQSLSDHDTITNEMQSALWLLNHWQIPLDTLFERDNPDYQVFYQTASTYSELAYNSSLLDETGSLTMLIKRLSHLTLPARISLVGFIEFTPLQTSFLEHLTSAGCHIEPLVLTLNHQSEQCYAFSDPSQEIAAMANWAYTTPKNSLLPILCVVPDLLQQRQEVQYHFDKLKTYHNSHANYNISGGKLLIEYPLIRMIMLTLKLFYQRVNIDTICEWLTSTYLIDYNIEISQRLQLSQYLRQNYYQPIDWRQMCQLILNSECDHLKQEFLKINATGEQLNKNSTIEIFNLIIDSFFALKLRSLSSLEF